MSIIVYPDVIVPTSAILAGVTGTRTRQNDRTVNQGGYATVNAVRDVSLLTYQIGIAPMLVSDAQAIIALYETTDAGAFGMLMDDPIDFTVTGAQGGLIGYMSGVANGTVGFGNGTPLYGLRKLYTAPGGRQKGRAITRPKGTPPILRNGSPVTVGVSVGNISLSAAPVYVTFVADASSNVSGVTVGATTQVVLSGALAGLGVGGKLWLQGLTGANASLLNNLAHTITAVAGATYTLSTNTAGKTITAAGQGQKYPQPTDTLTWTGDFYVPVHFRDDSIQWEIVAAGQRDSRLVTIPATYIDEIRES